MQKDCLICKNCANAYPTDTFLGQPIKEVTEAFEAKIASGEIKMSKKQLEKWHQEKATRGNAIIRTCSKNSTGFENSSCLVPDEFKPKQHKDNG